LTDWRSDLDWNGLDQLILVFVLEGVGDDDFIKIIMDAAEAPLEYM